MMPGTPYVSMGMEAFNDTPLVNGTAYPTLTVDPKAYRFRILNAANDRFFNLSLYVAIDANGNPCDPDQTAPVPESTGVTCTEVRLNDSRWLLWMIPPSSRPPIRPRLARTGSRSAPRAASCPLRQSSPPSRPPG